MTSFATSDDAAGFAYPLPDASADGLLARATQALVDAAGFGILSADATVRLGAHEGHLDLDDVPLVADVSAVALVNEDSTTEPVTGWHWREDSFRVYLDHTVPERHCGLFAVTLTQGLASVPASLKMLTSAVAYRFAAMPSAMAAGIVSRSVGGVSWSASKVPETGDLTDGELRKLRKIVPVKHVWVVPA